MPDITYLDRYIREGKSEKISLKNLYDSLLVSHQDHLDHIYRVSFGDFFLQHRDHIADAIQLFQISESAFYKPKMVSMELYGTTELWLSLLRVNNLCRISEFHYPIIKIYNPNMLQNYIETFFKRDGKR